MTGYGKVAKSIHVKLDILLNALTKINYRFSFY